ncbi:RNA polymerase sigma-70 factor (ECF subfamily) [Parabacteroides sp. PF5-5]|uniref:RNA polymerase sigma-70 factor n=1 Tax=unclassified Parabacteroides TaxID=2649774 RepID=UPI002476EC5F|nr:MULTISPECIES: RNA polymerase sigma-70 factor [unclassified Parabacteroides]MDH6304807.1 RNA polymerase sigma-70 factor (ECF subfamily) [Parabacteroides sp. PH5-39]MDH6315579.1 RNA polymerase sigma-70 factor (ECF subfamily) [Parabacteroides sp. PF5-13]MDH6319239.1 RNA polymerase sigma-70 factor (ECF subfamily) [Parabacteroides sp. PH5-13]MDH6322970.1 RNA polymerase sigma-70 factor (ECF subfamily) [Parabacteroides sp. PH5-8]MDH6326772.1 RNA polymerase sigma-70 factor (ECF subfamily) [Parabact
MINNELLIRLLKEGNEQAFENVYKEYYRGLCAFASQYVDDTSECEEIVQDVMMWLWENRLSLVPEMSVKSLLFTIVKNKCLNSISHKQIKQRVHESLFLKFEEQFEDPDLYIESEMMACLDKAIQNLPTDYREAFTLNRFENMTYNEIAERMDVSSKTIAYRIGQALKILREDMKEYLPLLLFLMKL